MGEFSGIHSSAMSGGEGVVTGGPLLILTC